MHSLLERSKENCTTSVILRSDKNKIIVAADLRHSSLWIAQINQFQSILLNKIFAAKNLNNSADHTRLIGMTS